MKENEMDGARDTWGEEDRNTYCIWRIHTVFGVDVWWK